MTVTAPRITPLAALADQLAQRLAAGPLPRWKGPVSLTKLLNRITGMTASGTEHGGEAAAVTYDPVEARVQDLVRSAPPLTEETRAKLAMLLTP